MTPAIPLADSPSRDASVADAPLLDDSLRGSGDDTPAVRHDNNDYEESHLDMLARMQERHFWYRVAIAFCWGRSTATCPAALSIRAAHRRSMSEVVAAVGCATCVPRGPVGSRSWPWGTPHRKHCDTRHA